jgi:hypothetical protein
MLRIIEDNGGSSVLNQAVDCAVAEEPMIAQLQFRDGTRTQGAPP